MVYWLLTTLFNKQPTGIQTSQSLNCTLYVVLQACRCTCMPVSCKVLLSFESTRQTHTTCSITPMLSSSLHKHYFKKEKKKFNGEIPCNTCTLLYTGKIPKAYLRLLLIGLWRKLNKYKYRKLVPLSLKSKVLKKVHFFLNNTMSFIWEHKISTCSTPTYTCIYTL